MSSLRALLRPAAAAHCAAQGSLRPYHVTPLRRAYKDDQDRESLAPRSTENTKTGTDQQVAGANPDAAFNPDKTSPEAAEESASPIDGFSGNPLEGRGDAGMSRPRGDERSGKDRGVGKEVSKGKKSSGHSAQKNGGPGRT